MTESANINFNLYEIMEQLNRIELRGTVIWTTWHNVTAWESKDIQNLERIEKGSKVHVVGRIRNQRFCGTDGVERSMYEVVARTVEPIDDQEVLQYQM